MLSFSSYIEDIDELINAGCCNETIHMTHEFNYKLILAMDKYLTYSFYKLNSLPPLTMLRLRLEVFIISNFDGFDAYTKFKNLIKEHSGYLFDNVIDLI
jgi:hypothetical protein